MAVEIFYDDDADLSIIQGRKVAVIGQTVADKLFGQNSNPTGQSIRVKNIPFTVVGVLAKKGQSQWGQDYDDIVIVPYTTFQQKIKGGLKNFIEGQLSELAASDMAPTEGVSAKPALGTAGFATFTQSNPLATPAEPVAPAAPVSPVIVSGGSTGATNPFGGFTGWTQTQPTAFDADDED